MSYTINKNSLALLDIDIYALKRRTDLLVIALEMKLDGRLTESWRAFYTEMYNSLTSVEQLPYLVTERVFPESHYIIDGPKRITSKFLKKKFKEIVKCSNQLSKNAAQLDNMIKNDQSHVANLRSHIIWENWLTDVKDINYEIADAKGMFID